MPKPKIQIKRVYDACSKEDGLRVLVDRLWPRGISKGKAQIDLWMKSLAPSAELRTWFSHESQKWPKFKERYRKELRKNEKELETLIAATKKGPLTLLFAAKETQFNNAAALKDYLESR